MQSAVCRLLQLEIAKPDKVWYTPCKGSDALKKFEGMLFCTDLDGTLYRDDRTVSKENLDAIEYFKAEGGLFTFITGRPPKTAEEMCNTVKPNAPFGCLNGGGIYDFQERKFLWKTYLPEAGFALVKEVDQKLPQVRIHIHTEQGIIFKRDPSKRVHFLATDGPIEPDEGIVYVQEPVFKVVFAHEDAQLRGSLIELLHSHPKAREFSFIRSEEKFYEILPKGSNKGTLLGKMAQLLGINPKKIIAVGDYNNDVSMLQAAGLGIAVANAVDEVKAVADYITVSNNEHAIANIIHKLDQGLFDFT